MKLVGCQEQSSQNEADVRINDARWRPLLVTWEWTETAPPQRDVNAEGNSKLGGVRKQDTVAGDVICLV
ncbi:hypothetical protein DPEC_G00120900 [Dallia pectoralis]|uniref:Uncharacterized protein n=1 Tax=Dallia pectoralis TaxID=75939 RepID=A0ACC2GQ05_DALPE|nr:hypothetical protein DPEC_G00120900 [Dallia pectoralis]